MLKILSKFLRPNIEFYCLLPGIKDLYPITRANNYRPKWIKDAAENYKQKMSAVPNKKITSVLKCPGIAKFMSRGYILYNYFDFAVRAENPNLPLFLDTTLDQSRLYGGTTGLGRYLDAHTPDTLSMFMAPPVGANTSILKINTGWRIKAPDDLIFLELPVYFSDENKFLTVSGILDPRDAAQINPSFWWLANDDQWHVIKAGTPLVQYIPVPRKYADDFVVRDATEKENKQNRILDVMLNSSFQTNVSVRNELIKKIFKDI